MKNKIMWKDVTLIVLAILLIFSMCRIHTLKQSNKKLYSQNLELNHQLATLKEKNTGLESKLNSEEIRQFSTLKIEEKFPDPGFFSSFLFIQSFD